MKVKITSIKQLEEISGVGAGVGQPIEGTVVDKKECLCYQISN